MVVIEEFFSVTAKHSDASMETFARILGGNIQSFTSDGAFRDRVLFRFLTWKPPTMLRVSILLFLVLICSPDNLNRKPETSTCTQKTLVRGEDSGFVREQGRVLQGPGKLE